VMLDECRLSCHVCDDYEYVKRQTYEFRCSITTHVPVCTY
jgi:hypothetical protein